MRDAGWQRRNRWMVQGPVGRPWPWAGSQGRGCSPPADLAGDATAMVEAARGGGWRSDGDDRGPTATMEVRRWLQGAVLQQRVRTDLARFVLLRRRHGVTAEVVTAATTHGSRCGDVRRRRRW
ncbi:unnamed protein product [Urochloa humidicola]